MLRRMLGFVKENPERIAASARLLVVSCTATYFLDEYMTFSRMAKKCDIITGKLNELATLYADIPAPNLEETRKLIEQKMEAEEAARKR